MNRVFADSSAIIAYFCKRDEKHHKAAAGINRLRDEDRRMILGLLLHIDDAVGSRRAGIEKIDIIVPGLAVPRPGEPGILRLYRFSVGANHLPEVLFTAEGIGDPYIGKPGRGWGCQGIVLSRRRKA